VSGIPPDRRYRADEPSWYRKLCTRGHALRVHGRARGESGYYCARCVTVTRRALRERRRQEVPLLPTIRTRHCEPDPVAVARLVAGQRHGAVVHGAEVFEAVRILTERGWSIRLTAERVQASERTVARIRRKIRKGRAYGQAG
jgi:transposase-like protein